MTRGSSTTIEYDVAVPMADGTELATDVYRRSDSGRWPVILVRTPYGKVGGPDVGTAFGFSILEAVRSGYAVVVQDSRGTGGSEGEFQAMRDEASDGSDAVAWASAQPWSSGAVGMFGGSYLAGVQFAAAARRPTALRAIVPIVAYLDEMLYQGGALRLGNNLPWCLGMARAQATRAGLPSEIDEQLAAALGDIERSFRHLPLRDFERMSPWLERQLGDWLTTPDEEHVWTPMATPERAADMAVPALHIAGSFDFFLNGGLAAYQALRDSAATEEARANQRLIVIPAPHGGPMIEMGDLWFGPEAVALDLGAIFSEWFGAWLKGEPLPERDPVQVFVSGIGRWRGADDWPLPGTVSEPWYLRSGGKLARTPPTGEDPDEYLYDPADPVPTVSGQVTLPGPDGAFCGGPRDRRRVHGRPDVLVYVSDVLQDDLAVIGPVVATLHVSSSTVDTDFTAALIDVDPDGRAIGITDGILRLRYRDGLDRPAMLEPGRVYEIEVDLVAAFHVFLAGHRIAMEISSSNFPRFDRNPNHGGVIAEATEADFVVVRQRVFHDADRASYVTLPVVPA